MGVEIFGREMGLPIRDRQERGCGFVVIIGERYSSPPTEPTEPLAASSYSGERLRSLADLSSEEYERRADRANLLPGSGQDEWDMMAARQRAAEFISLLQHRFVILLGRKVASAFGIFSQWFEETRSYSAEYYVMPHPSGMNRWWNTPRNMEQAREFMSWALSGR